MQPIRRLFAAGVLLLLSKMTYAVQPADIWQYCSFNYAGTEACFNSFGEAEAYMRQENPSGPTGRKFLEMTSGPTFAGPLNSPTSISYGYTVKPRGPVAYLEDYLNAITLGWGGVSPQGVICGCPNVDGSGAAQCYPYGNETTCADTPNACNSCRAQGGDASGIESAITTYFSQIPNSCNVHISQVYPWPAPADFSGPFSIGSNNFQGLIYNNSDYGSGAPDDPFNFEIAVTHGVISNGQCSSGTGYFVVTRQQHIQCDAGLSEISVITNAQATYSPDQVTDIGQICRSAETGQIIASMVSSCQANYGDPCVPGSGSQVETETDYASESFSFKRTYNSLRLAATNSLLGTGWYTDYASSLSIPNGTSSAYVVCSDGQGNTERFDQQGTTSSYRSVNMTGSVLTWVSSGGTSWLLNTADGQQWTFDSTGKLKSRGFLSKPESLITFSYGPVYSSGGVLQVPAGSVGGITDAKGRIVVFTYGTINSAALCGAGADPNCQSVRLTSVVYPSGATVSFAYDTSGNLQTGHVPRRKWSEVLLQRISEPLSFCSTVGIMYWRNRTHWRVPASPDGNLRLNGATAIRFATYQYDYRGRVVSSALAGNADQLTLSYTSPTQTVLKFAYGSSPTQGLQKTIDFTMVGGMFRKEQTVTDKNPITNTQSATQYAYDSSGRVQTKTNANGVKTTYEYTNNFDITAQVDASTTADQRRVETRIGIRPSMSQQKCGQRMHRVPSSESPTMHTTPAVKSLRDVLRIRPFPAPTATSADRSPMRLPECASGFTRTANSPMSPAEPVRSSDCLNPSMDLAPILPIRRASPISPRPMYLAVCRPEARATRSETCSRLRMPWGRSPTTSPTI